MQPVNQSSHVGSVNLDQVTSTSSEALLLLFAQASDSHQQAEKEIQNRVMQSIEAKNLLTGLNTALQQVKWGAPGNDGKPDSNLADTQEFEKRLDDAISQTTDPSVRAELEKVRDTYFRGADWQTDKKIDKTEFQEIQKTLDNSVTTLDDNMQILTLNLKQQEEKFSQVTSLVKEIMDANKKTFETIMARG